MQSSDLSRDQARALKNKLQPMLGYLNRLKRRMGYRGFRPDDPLMLAVGRALDAMHALHVEVHYLTCGDATGRLPIQRSDQKKLIGSTVGPISPAPITGGESTADQVEMK